MATCWCRARRVWASRWMSPSSIAIRGSPARGRISARIRRPRPAPSPPITPSSGSGGSRDEQGMNRDRFRYYDLLVHTFVVILLISNLVGQKITAVGPFRFSGAMLFFPITYIFGDVFTEVYGYGASRRAIWIGFFAASLLAAMGMITVWLPPAPGWDGQAAFARVFNFVPRIIASSLAAFWCGEFANSFVMAKMKLLTKGRYLWTRTVGSTVAGQALD